MEALIESAVVALMIAGPMFALAGLVLLTDRLLDRHYRRTHRFEELDQWTEDWRDECLDFFRGRKSRDERLARALNRTCFSEKSEDRIAPGPLTDMEVTHGSRTR